MKIGVLSDIHSNLPALEAVLPRLEGCDRLVCCGDIIGIGPFPEETVRRLAGLKNLTAVRGNHERYLLEEMPETVPNPESMSREEIAMHHWEHARLSVESKRFLRALPLRAAFEAEGLTISVVHYPTDEQGRYLPAPRRGEDAAPLFEDMDGGVILFGHDHAPAAFSAGKARCFNPGALGCPGEAGDVARAGILTVENGSCAFEPLEIHCDMTETLSAMRRFNYPGREEIERVFFGIR